MRAILAAVGMTLILCECAGQARNYNMIFGSSNWLNFYNEQLTIIPSTFAVTARNATMSEPDGALSLVVDETGIHNANFDLVQDGSAQDLGWPARLASLLILPKPDAPFHYFVFVNTPEVDKQAGYVEVDMSMNLGAGGVVGSGTTWYMSNTTAKIAATTHGNGVDYWVLQHADGTDTFHAFRIGPGGLNPVPIISATGPLLSATPVPDRLSSDFWGPMKFSVSGDQLAFGFDHAPDSAGAAVFWFNSSTGTVTVRNSSLAYTAYDLDDYTGDTIAVTLPMDFTSGLDFLTTDDRLYVAYLDTSIDGSGGFFSTQYDLTVCDGCIPHTSLASNTSSVGVGTEWGADTTGGSLVLGPDGELYLRNAGSNQGFLHWWDNVPHEFNTSLGGSTLISSPDLHETWGFPLFCKRYHDSDPAWLGLREEDGRDPAFRAVPKPALNDGPTTVLVRKELPAGLYALEVFRKGRPLGSTRVIIE
ncbi:MAG: hypothetical protein HUU33_11635 [Flavobacteriales bacterium]|nr:hypothetical protein [Flavobacteriales bacterium]